MHSPKIIRLATSCIFAMTISDLAFAQISPSSQQTLVELLRESLSCPLAIKTETYSVRGAPSLIKTLLSYSFSGTSQVFSYSYTQIEDDINPEGESYRHTAKGAVRARLQDIATARAQGSALQLMCSAQKPCISDIVLENSDGIVCPHCPHGDTRESKTHSTSSITIELCGAETAKDAAFAIGKLTNQHTPNPPAFSSPPPNGPNVSPRQEFKGNGTGGLIDSLR